MATSVLFSNDKLEAIYLPGSKEFLLITFSALDFSQTTDVFWGRHFAEKSGYSALGFVAKANNWYPYAAMLEASVAIQDVLGGFRKIITYGSSMGAYVAMKYGSLLGATTSVAFGPQYSINPADGVSETAYTKYYVPSLHNNMAVNSRDLAAKAFVFYDPYDRFDKKNASFFSDLGQSVLLVPMYHAGHECIKAVSGSNSARAILETCLNSNIKDVRILASKLRRSSSARTAGVANSLLAKNPKNAFDIVEKHKSTLDKNSWRYSTRRPLFGTMLREMLKDL